MKAALAQFIYESNTFAPAGVEIDLFQEGGVWLDRPAAVRDWAHTTDGQMRGSLEALEAAGWETAPCFAAVCGSPAGRLSTACFHQLRDTLLARIEQARPFDALVLHLHGAACAQGEDDIEGHILEQVRTELGFAGRLVLSLDLHANFTRRMLQYADAVTAYRTFPHMDFVETGQRAARLALHPGPFQRAVAKIAALMPPTDGSHFDGHLADLQAGARRLEQAPGVLDACVLPVQPWMDIDELGSALVVTSAGQSPLTELEQLAREWYGQRHAWQTRLTDWSTILTCLQRRDPQPWILADTADTTTGGSPGHSVEALRRLLPHKDDLPGQVLLWVVDPATVQAALRGAAHFTTGEPALEWQGRVLWTGAGRYKARGKAYTGQAFSMGPAAVIEAGQLRLVACSYPALVADPAFYECVGLHPDRALAVQVKSMAGWMPGFGLGPERGLLFDGPGATSLDFTQIPFTGSGRRLYPVDPEPDQPIELWETASASTA